jgi:hypothetical protein
MAVAPNKADFISKKVYGGRLFTRQSIAKSYEDLSFQSVSSKTIELVHNCANGSDTLGSGTGVVPVNHLVFDSPLPGALVSCLERGLNERISLALDDLRANEFEACDVLAAGETDLRAKLFVRLNPEISKYVSQQATLEPLLKAVNGLRDAVRTQVDPREAFIHCFRQADPQVCFQNSVSEGFDRAAQPFATAVGDLLLQERATYLERNAFDPIAAKVSDFYRGIFAGVETRIGDAAKTRWTDCLDQAAPADTTALLTQPFTGGAYFVSTPLLNCVNTAIVDDIKRVRDRFVGSLVAITDPDAQAFLNQLFQPVYVARLQKELEQSVTAEEAVREQRRSSVVDVLVGGLLAKVDWVEASMSAAQAQAKCAPLAQSAFDTYFANPGLSEKLPVRFKAIEDVRRAWSEEACTRAVASPVVAQVVQANVDQAWKQALTELDGDVATRAGTYAGTCATRYPDTPRRSLVRDRRKCLTNSWNAVESEAMGDWDQSPAGKQFASRRSDAKQGLIRRRTQLLEDAIRKMETH